jgi:hypothetical protein
MLAEICWSRIPYYLLFLIPINKFYPPFLSPLHFDNTTPHKKMARNVNSRQKQTVMYVTRCTVHTCSGRNSNICLMHGQIPASLRTSPSRNSVNQLLLRYAVKSLFHALTLRGEVIDVHSPLNVKT